MISHWESRMKKRVASIIWGVCLICFGIWIAGSVLGIWEFTIFFNGWWTLFVIIPCIAKILSGERKKGAWIGLTIGVLLFMASQRWISYVDFWRVFLPSLFIFIGLDISLGHSEFSKKYHNILFGFVFLFILGGILFFANNAKDSVQEESAFIETLSKEFEQEQIEQLLVTAKDLEIEVKQGDKFSIKASGVTEEFEAVVKDKTLIIRQNSDSLFQNLFEPKKSQAKVILTVPEKFILKKAVITCGSGKFSIDGLKTQIFKLTGGSGFIYLKNLIVQEQTELTVNSGKTVLEDVELFNAEIVTGSGNFSLNGSLKGKNQIDSGSGNTAYALLGTLKDYKIFGRGGSGDIWLNGEKYSTIEVEKENTVYSISIKGGSGRIVIDFREDVNEKR